MNHSEIKSYFRTETVFRRVGNVVSGAPGMRFHPEGEYKPRLGQPCPATVFDRLRSKRTGEYIDSSGNHYPLSPGSIFQRLPDVPHSTILDPRSGWVECFVGVHASYYQLVKQLFAADLSKPVFTIGLDLSLVKRFDLVLRGLKKAPETYLPHYLTEVLDLIMELFNRIQNAGIDKKDIDLLTLACRLLESSPDERIPLKTVLSAVPMGYERIRKLFREQTGTSPGDYRIRRRIEKACSLLSEGKSRIKEIAFNLGYPNEFAFANQFKKYTGVSPTVFRRGR